MSGVTGDSAALPLATSRDVRRLILPLLGRRGMAVLALSFAAILSASAFALVLPATLGRLVDIAQTGSDPEAAIIAVAWAAASIGGAVIIGAAASALGFFGVSRIVEPVLARLREQVVSATLTLP